MGLDNSPEFEFSLDMFAADPAIVRAVLDVLHARKVKGQRTFQICGGTLTPLRAFWTVVASSICVVRSLDGSLVHVWFFLYAELKHLIGYAFERAGALLPAKERAALQIRLLPAYNQVVAALQEAGHEKRCDAKLRSALDEDALRELGALLSDSEANRLRTQVSSAPCSVTARPNRWRTQVEAFLSAKTPAEIDKALAFRWQAHFITYLLVGNSIPCQRTEILVSLKIGRNFLFDDTKRCWKIDTGSCVGKTKQPLVVYFPKEDTQLVRRWLDDFRPVLMAQNGGTTDHGFLFANQDASVRKDIAFVVKQVQREYIGRAIGPHRFRSQQVHESKRKGISKVQHEALCQGRMHSTAICDSAYTPRPSLKRSAEVAVEYLAGLRANQKRQKTDDAALLANDDDAEAKVEAEAEFDHGGDEDTDAKHDGDQDDALAVHVAVKKERKDKDVPYSSAAAVRGGDHGGAGMGMGVGSFERRSNGHHSHSHSSSSCASPAPRSSDKPLGKAPGVKAKAQANLENASVCHDDIKIKKEPRDEADMIVID